MIISPNQEYSETQEDYDREHGGNRHGGYPGDEDVSHRSYIDRRDSANQRHAHHGTHQAVCRGDWQSHPGTDEHRGGSGELGRESARGRDLRYPDPMAFMALRPLIISL